MVYLLKMEIFHGYVKLPDGSAQLRFGAKNWPFEWYKNDGCYNFHNPGWRFFQVTGLTEIYRILW